MQYYLYQITNKVNGKIYVGVHKTKFLDDGYMGSGKVIRRAITKYGIENFTKDILEFFENAELMYAREKEIVTDEFLLLKNTYNLQRGGHGGFDYLNKNRHIIEAKYTPVRRRNTGNIIQAREQATKLLEDPIHREQKRQSISRGIRKYLSESGPRWWVGKHHTNATKQKIGNANRIKSKGDKNSQFGSIWITDGTNNKKIKNIELIPDGWKKGRIC